jgi:uncharacterized caspase-like protein
MIVSADKAGLMDQAISRTVFVLLVLVVSSVPMTFASENRVALVIGNSAYRHAPVLDNPKNDASDMAAAAEKLGFKVMKGLDLDKSGMDKAIRQFAETLRDGSIGMFFYAGHGLQVGGRNYLVPIDAELKTAEALDFEMVGLDVIQRAMETASETNILFVDACRDNPLARNLARAMGTRSSAIGRGLTIQEAGAGTLISFSTQPGNVALDSTGSRNSPYAAALAKHITTPGKDLPAILVQVRRDVMATTGKRQIPWEHSALTAEVILTSQAAQTSVNPPKADAPESNDGAKSEMKVADAKPAEQETKPEAAKRNVVNATTTIGYVMTINTKHVQWLANAEGEHVGEYLYPDKSIAVPPGRYGLIDNNGGFASVPELEIKAGEQTVVDLAKHVGELTIVNTKNIYWLANAQGEHVGEYLYPDKPIAVLPGHYRLMDNSNGLVSVEHVEIKAGEETVINFGK